MKLFILVTFLFSLNGLSKIEDVFKGQTKIKDPFSLRDPFQPPKFKSKTQQKQKQIAKGILDNTKKLDKKFNLEQLKVIGVLIGKNRRVVVQSQGKNYTLKEGDNYGSGPVIKAILPGGLILVEQITNVYGENEFIETVVPISN